MANPRVLPGMKEEATVMVRKFESDTLTPRKREFLWLRWQTFLGLRRVIWQWENVILCEQ